MKFLEPQLVLELHHDNIEEFGGAHGIRDEGAFESALYAAEYRAEYAKCDLIECAATYGFHLCQAHAFVDGNKRVGAGAAVVFLRLNGFRLTCSREELAEVFLSIAAGQTSREQLEDYLRQHAIRAA